MKFQKRILLIFLSLMLLLTVKNFAYEAGDTITYNGIEATFPEVKSSSSEEAVLEDPIYLKKISSVSTVSVGSSGLEITISNAIKKFETTGNEAVGIDVSYWQGDIDWKKVADSGVKFAMIRCGNRGAITGTIWEDEKFEEYIQGAIDNGIYVGIYFYSAAITDGEALQEAMWVADIIKDYDIKYPVAYDYEDFSAKYTSLGEYRTNALVGNTEQVNRNAEIFLSYIRSKGYTACNYGSKNYLETIWNSEINSKYDVWVAQYLLNSERTKTTYQGAYKMWQYTDAGSIDGIDGDVDIDIDYSYYMNLHNVDISGYMFNVTYYADKNPDLKAVYGYNVTYLKNHYENFGKKEGRAATPAFDVMYYLGKNADLKKAFGTDYVAAYNHFVNYGIREGRSSSKCFDVNEYLENNKDVKKAYYASKTLAYVHFVNYGIKEGRISSNSFNVVDYYKSQSSYVKKQLGKNYVKYYALAAGGSPINDPAIDISSYMFDATYYADENPDLKAVFGYNETALRNHYESCGKIEGRSASLVFDPRYYISRYGDLESAFGTDYVAAYNHFVTNGINEGRQGSKNFSVIAYEKNYSDLAEEFGTNYSKALAHYVLYGRDEGRSGV